MNTDLYAVKISKLPDGFSFGEELFAHFRKNFNDLMSRNLEAEDKASARFWNSDNPVGSIMVFEDWRDNAAVLTTQASSRHWVFTPVGTAINWEHPLAGHRQFGLGSDSAGTLFFYTTGVDMMWDLEDHLFNMTQKGGRFFNIANDLWNEVMDNAVDFINKNGGKAEKTHSFRRAIDWDIDVKNEDKE